MCFIKRAFLCRSGESLPASMIPSIHRPGPQRRTENCEKLQKSVLQCPCDMINWDGKPPKVAKIRSRQEPKAWKYAEIIIWTSW